MKKEFNLYILNDLHMKMDLLKGIILLLFIISCKICNSSQYRTYEKQKIEVVVPNKVEDFNEFIKLFYSDSSFQKSRIKFPLKGIHYRNNGMDFESKRISIWKKEEWMFLKNIFSNNDSITVIDRDIFKRRISKTNTLVTENIFLENSGFNRLLKYALKKGKWYLIYYEEASF